MWRSSASLLEQKRIICGAVVVHNNFVVGKAKKIARFKQVGFWAV